MYSNYVIRNKLSICCFSSASSWFSGAILLYRFSTPGVVFVLWLGSNCRWFFFFIVIVTPTFRWPHVAGVKYIGIFLVFPQIHNCIFYYYFLTVKSLPAVYNHAIRIFDKCVDTSCTNVPTAHAYYSITDVSYICSSRVNLVRIFFYLFCFFSKPNTCVTRLSVLSRSARRPPTRASFVLLYLFR